MNLSVTRLDVTANRLLAALPASALSLIHPHLTYVSLATGAIVYDVGDEMDQLYFPSSGVTSLQTIMKDGRAIDTAIVGSDGALGAMAAHTPCPAAVRCVVRSTITAFTISALEYRRAAAGEATLQALVIHYQDTLLAQTRASAVRYASLSVDQRLAACLLDVSSLLASDSVPLTQDTLAEMLAVRRSSISEVGSKLKAAGVIDYSRDEIKILDRALLSNLALMSTKEGVGP